VEALRAMIDPSANALGYGMALLRSFCVDPRGGVEIEHEARHLRSFCVDPRGGVIAVGAGRRYAARAKTSLRD